MQELMRRFGADLLRIATGAALPLQASEAVFEAARAGFGGVRADSLRIARGFGD